MYILNSGNNTIPLFILSKKYKILKSCFNAFFSKKSHIIGTGPQLQSTCVIRLRCLGTGPTHTNPNGMDPRDFNGYKHQILR